jgi:hypothetical protein
MTLSLLSYIENLPSCIGIIEYRLYYIGSEVLGTEEIKINTLAMSEMERDRRTTNHIKAPLTSSTKEGKKLSLGWREDILMHDELRDNMSSML